VGGELEQAEHFGYYHSKVLDLTMYFGQWKGNNNYQDVLSLDDGATKLNFNMLRLRRNFLWTP